MLTYQSTKANLTCLRRKRVNLNVRKINFAYHSSFNTRRSSQQFNSRLVLWLLWKQLSDFHVFMAASSSCENCSFSIANSHTQIELSRDSFACLLVYSSSSACCCESVAIFERKYEHLLFLLSKVYVFPLFDAFSNTAFAVVTCEVERNKKKTSLLPPLSSDSIFRTPGKKRGEHHTFCHHQLFRMWAFSERLDYGTRQKIPTS